MTEEQEKLELLRQFKEKIYRVKELKEKGLIGKASIDKPWLKYYTDEAINTKLPEMTLYEYAHKANKNNPNAILIDYFGRKIRSFEFFSKVESTAIAYKEIGVRKGDIVPLITPNFPEVMYSIYALRKIGAIVFPIDPRTNASRIREQINMVDAKNILMIDLCGPKIENIINQTSVKKTIVISASDSLSPMVKILYKNKKENKKQNNYNKKLLENDLYLSWDDFIRNGKKYKRNIDELYEKDNPGFLVLTGGTTGQPKAVMLSDDSMNAVAEQYKLSPMPFEQGQSFLGIMPPFIAYGLTFIHVALSSGVTNQIIPKFEPEKFDQLLLKKKPNHTVGVPTHFENLLQSELLKNADLSFLVTASAGGDAMLVELEKRTNEFLKNIKITKGYGMTELNSSAATTYDNCNEPGSVGIPLVKNTVGIFKVEPDENKSNDSIYSHQKELGYNKVGEICFKSPSMMLGYYNREEENKKTIKIHDDGSVWVHTRDLGYINEDGKIFVKNRLKRMVIRPDGHNVFPSELESIIMKNSAIDNCVVVGKSSECHSQGQFPKAFIKVKDTFKDNMDDIVNQLEVLCEDSLPERDVPYYYEYIEDVPLTLGGKVDYKQLEQRNPKSKVYVVEKKDNPVSTKSNTKRKSKK